MRGRAAVAIVILGATLAAGCAISAAGATTTARNKVTVPFPQAQHEILQQRL